MTELRECPFCGSPGRASDYDDHNGRMCYVVTCSNDDCLVSELVASGDTESEAASRWNRRADPWRPISEAPRKEVLLYFPEISADQRKASVREMWKVGYPGMTPRQETHWMPLPPPAKDQE